MILHTVIDPMEVMGQTPPQLVWQKTHRGFVQMRLDTNPPQLERIFSTDPADYLQKELQPGQLGHPKKKM